MVECQPHFTLEASRTQDVVGLAAADARLGLTCSLNSGTHFYAASAIKATIISALLLKVGGVGHLSSSQHALAWRMITESDNKAATALWNETGISGLQRFLNRAGMSHTVLDNNAWGLSLLTAHDEVTLLKLLTNRGRVLSTRPVPDGPRRGGPALGRDRGRAGQGDRVRQERLAALPGAVEHQ